MKEIIYKVSFEKYHNIEYENFVSIDQYSKLPQAGSYLENDLISAGRNNFFTVKSLNYDQEYYVKNYGNPLSSINKHYMMIVVEKNEDKVSLKVFTGFRGRRAGVSWFKVVKEMNFLTVNLKTGDVYTGDLRNYHKKKKFTKSIRRNNFYGQIIATIKAAIKNKSNVFTKDGYIHAKEAISHLLKFIDNGKYEESMTDSDRIFKFYLDKRKIKYPNNFGVYSEIFTEKDFKKILKKNDLKLVDSFMIHKSIKGKKIKRSLHLCEKLNVNLLKGAQMFFGEDWVNQEDDFIIKCLNFEVQYTEDCLGKPDLYTKEEIKRIFKIFKQTFFELELDNYTFFDHFHMYSQLKRYGETDLKWESSTVQDFRKEHLDWSNKLDFYRRGFYNRIYPEHYYNILKDPIIVSGEKYYPVLLDQTSTYNEESSTQSNCVKTYIGRPGSSIISLRKNSPDSDIRATLEYFITKTEEEKINFQRIQSLGKFNQKLENEWSEALFKLDELFLLCIRDKKYHNVRITKKCANGIFLESDSNWDEGSGKLKWAYKEIEHV